MGKGAISITPVTGRLQEFHVGETIDEKGIENGAQGSVIGDVSATGDQDAEPQASIVSNVHMCTQYHYRLRSVSRGRLCERRPLRASHGIAYLLSEKKPLTRPDNPSE